MNDGGLNAPWSRARSRANGVAGFVQRLRELGWSEGRDLAIEYRWAEGRSERFIEIAACRVRAHRAGGVSSGAARQKFQDRIGLARPEKKCSDGLVTIPVQA